MNPNSGLSPQHGKKILVVGGYGAVGIRICRELTSTGERVIVAGRKSERARKVAAECGAEARHLDLNDPSTWAVACRDVGCVVVCMDQSTTDFVRFVFDLGVHYVDLTASEEFFRRVEALPPSSASALLSVGLSPGLTNILAAQCASGMSRVDEVEIGIMSAIGDNHGAAGIAWLTDQIFDPQKSTDRRRLDFGNTWGKRSAYRVDFADQHVLRRHFGAAEAATRICLTSKPLTAALFAFVRRFAGNEWARKTTEWILSMAQWREGICVIAVAVTGEQNGTRTTTRAQFAGTGELEITARIGAEMIRTFLRNPAPVGVWHSHQLMTLDSLSETPAFRLAGELSFQGTPAGE